MANKKIQKMIIESAAFKNGGEISRKYACDGVGTNPPLVFKNVPENTKSLALIVDDPDAPRGTWDHWVLWNVPPEVQEIAEGSTPMSAVVWKNSWPANAYGAPCPPSGSHRYYFRLYALDALLNLSSNSNSDDLRGAMEGHVVAEAELMGRYQRK